MTPCPASHRQRKIRGHKRPCAYYSNPTATFHALLVGDLVFKLNPGPTVNCVPAVVWTRSDHQQIAQLSRPSRNLGNLININCSIDWMDINTQRHYANSIFVWSKRRTLISWTMFAIVSWSFCYYWDLAERRWCGCTGGIVPWRYKFIEHPRFGRRGGGTGLVYRSS